MCKNDEVLCVETVDGLKPIESNGIKKCLYCKVDITPENDSGLERFVDGRITQPTCKQCEATREQESFDKSSLQELLEWGELLTEAAIEELELLDSTGPISCTISNMKKLQKLLTHLKQTKMEHVQ